MKKLFAGFLSLAMVCAMTGCTAESEEYKIAMITDSGSVTDKSFNQSAYEGVKAFGEENNITYKYYAPKDTDEAGLLSTIDDAVDNGAEIIVTPGFNFGGAVYEAQKKYPDLKIIAIDFSPNKNDDYVIGENTVSYMFCEQESGYAAGYAAVKEGYTQLGFMGGMALPAVINYGVGYVQGASDAAVELKTDVKINYTYTGTFNESPEIKTLASAWYSNGTEVVFSCGGQICNSVFAAAQEAGKFSIGVDSDQSGDSETVITSALKDVTGATQLGLQAWLDEKFPGGQQIVFEKSGGIVYPGKLANYSEEENTKIATGIKEGTIDIKSSADLTNDKGDPSELKFPNVTVAFE